MKSARLIASPLGVKLFYANFDSHKPFVCFHPVVSFSCRGLTNQEGQSITRKVARPTARRVRPAEESFADALDEELTTGGILTAKSQRDPLKNLPSSQDLQSHPPDAIQGEISSIVCTGVNAMPADNLFQESSSSLRGEGLLPNIERIQERQQWLHQLPLERFLDRLLNYLRSTSNKQLVDEEEEDTLFPVVIKRIKEFSVSQLLEIVSVLYARSTLLSYGIQLNDMVRDRIAAVASEAAKKRRSQTSDATNTKESNEEDLLFVDEEAEQKRLQAEDPILYDAENQITPEIVLQSLLVMSQSIRRKRDLPFFQMMGAYFAFFINHYRDSHDLVRVLTAFSRAKILPPKNFLGMMSRRFPVLCKNVPLETLPSYRAMVNFSKMKHEHMNIYRFLSDNILSTIEANVTESKAQMFIAQRKRKETSKEEVPSSTTSDGEKNAENCSGLPTPPTFTSHVEAADIKTQFQRMVGMKPSMFTKWLFILSKNGAPFQQYLRPLVEPIVIPMLSHFPPPSFSRLLTAIGHFKCDDAELLVPIIDFMCKGHPSHQLVSKKSDSVEQRIAATGRVYCPTRADLFVLLNMFCREGVSLPSNIHEFFQFCGDVFLESTLVFSNSSSMLKKLPDTSPFFKNEDHVFVLRPGDMCSIARYTAMLQRRVDISLESLAPLTALMGHFARRLLGLLQFRVVSLHQIDDFTDLCRQQIYPDEDGSLEKLMAKRSELAPFVDEDGMIEELDGSMLDIDVRETFFKIVMVNDAYRYIAYRPLPGSLQVDFRDALTKISALDMIQAVDLYEQCFPTALKPPTRLLLTRSFLAKFSKDGEEVLSDDGTELILRPPMHQFVTKADLESFVQLLQRTSMSVRSSPDLRKFIQVKATKLGLEKLYTSYIALSHDNTREERMEL